MTGASCEDICTLMIVAHWLLSGMRNVSSKVVEKIKTHFLFDVVLTVHRR